MHVDRHAIRFPIKTRAIGAVVSGSWGNCGDFIIRLAESRRTIMSLQSAHSVQSTEPARKIGVGQRFAISTAVAQVGEF